MAYAVITRDSEAAAPYAPAFRAIGLDAIAMPVTRTEMIEHGLDQMLRTCRYAAIACASARAASALVDAWNAPPRDDEPIGGPDVFARSPELATLPRGRAVWFDRAMAIRAYEAPALDDRGRAVLPEVWAVGRATADVLEAAGLRVVLDPAVRDGESLARAMIAARALANERVLVPRSSHGRTDAIRMLVDAGVIVETVDVYDTVPAPADSAELAEGLRALRSGDARICAVFAPSQVAALDALVGLSTIDPVYAAIGETTSEALRAAGARRIVVAAEPTPEGLANAVRAVYPHVR